MNNGEQLKMFGIQLQNFGTQVKNFGLQMQSIMGIQMENIGIRISNIGIQIFDIGNMLNQCQYNEMQMTNMTKQNPFIEMEIFDSPLNRDFSMMDYKTMGKKNNKSMSQKYNISFLRVINRIKTNISCNDKTTIEELIKNYAKKIGLKNDDIYNNKIYFLYNGSRISTQDKIKIKDCLKNGCEIKVVDLKNLAE